MTDISLPKTTQDEKIALLGYGFTMEISANAKPVLFDAQGKEIVDTLQRLVAQKALLMPLIQTLGSSWQQVLGGAAAPEIASDRLKSSKTSFTLPANNNELKIDPSVRGQDNTIDTDVATQAVSNTPAMQGTSTSMHFCDANKEYGNIGDIMPNGTVYAGISPFTNTKMFLMPEGVEKGHCMSWTHATKFAQSLVNQYGFHGSEIDSDNLHDEPELNDGGWRLPTLGEMKHIFENVKDIGDFKERKFWSGDYCMNFRSGEVKADTKDSYNYVRLVRSDQSLKR